jgi:hypothetical protein
MKTLFYFVSLILILIWSIGFIGYGIGGIFHGVLLLAFIFLGTAITMEIKLAHKYLARKYSA